MCWRIFGDISGLGLLYGVVWRCEFDASHRLTHLHHSYNDVALADAIGTADLGSNLAAEDLIDDFLDGESGHGVSYALAARMKAGKRETKGGRGMGDVMAEEPGGRPRERGLHRGMAGQRAWSWQGCLVRGRRR